MKNENILGHIVDKLAQVKAKIADLKIDEQTLRQELIVGFRAHGTKTNLVNERASRVIPIARIQ